MEHFIHFLEENKLFLLFLVIAVGYLLGKIKIRGFSLGIASVLFVGLAFGSLSENLFLPDMIHTIGLVFFVYTIGLQSGPGFFASFDKKGISINLMMVFILFLSACTTVLLGSFFDLNEFILPGLYCGSLTNTPALAAIVDTIKSNPTNLSPENLTVQLAEPIAGYSIAYPFGVMGVIFSLFLFKKIFRVDLAKEAEETANQLGLGSQDLDNIEVIINNPNIIGKKVSQVFLDHYKNIIISRIEKNGVLKIAEGETILEEGNIITLVGTPEEIRDIIKDFGEFYDRDLSADRSQLDFRRIFVSRKEVIGYTIQKLNLHQKFNATITRLKRGDSEIVPSPKTVLEAGDRIRVVAEKSQMEKVSKFFGDSFHSLSEIDYISISIGIALGLFVGEITIPLPGGSNFKLGSAGGPLIVSLILGYLGRSGKFIWGMPYNANLTLRQMGAVLFLAGIGLKAGYSFGANLYKYGLVLFSLGMLITTFNTVLMIVLGRKVLKISYPMLMGIISGMQTQPAVIAYSNAEVKNSVPNYGYSLVFPMAMITKILFVQLIHTALK
ncbi:MAG: transporter [Leptospiraceae bacterium]|nr:hypothetical protein [Leptospiraceae bacterium]MCP5513219.1 transporter [Leptospiraceae bacterium]